MLNYRNFIYKSSFKLVARCKSICQILYIDENDFEELRTRHEDIDKEFQKFLELEENSEKNIDKLILDYIMPLSEEDIRPVKVQKKRLHLTNILKNAAIKLLLQNKKNKPPSLRDILRNAIEKMRSAEANKKRKEQETELSEDDEEDDKDQQTSYMREVADEIAMGVNYTFKIINEFEQKLIEVKRERIKKRKANIKNSEFHQGSL